MLQEDGNGEAAGAIQDHGMKHVVFFILKQRKEKKRKEKQKEEREEKKTEKEKEPAAKW